MEWLDNVNVERKKEQGDRVSCEIFEIIMDRLEKDWFDLVRSFQCTFHSLYLNFTGRQRTYPNPIWLCHPRIRHAQSVMTRRERTPMQSCFVMGVTSLCIKIATECRIFPRVSGSVASVLSHPNRQW